MAAVQMQFGTPALTTTGGVVTVNFSDGSALEFPDAAGLQNWVLQRIPEVDVVKAIAIANRLAADPLMDSPQLWDGKTVTLDVEQANPANVFKVV